MRLISPGSIRRSDVGRSLFRSGRRGVPPAVGGTDPGAQWRGILPQGGFYPADRQTLSRHGARTFGLFLSWHPVPPAPERAGRIRAGRAGADRSAGPPPPPSIRCSVLPAKRSPPMALLRRNCVSAASPCSRPCSTPPKCPMSGGRASATVRPALLARSASETPFRSHGAEGNIRAPRLSEIEADVTERMTAAGLPLRHLARARRDRGAHPRKAGARRCLCAWRDHPAARGLPFGVRSG